VRSITAHFRRIDEMRAVIDRACEENAANELFYRSLLGLMPQCWPMAFFVLSNQDFFQGQ
jgi:hypothetical protein